MVVLGVLLLVARIAPPPRDLAGFRIRAYATHAAWFVALLMLVATIARAWDAPLRRLLTAVAVLALVIVVGSIADQTASLDVVKVVFAALAGAAFVRTLERPWWLLPICILVPLADAWSVLSERGVTNAVVDRAAEEPAWIMWPTIATPIAGLPYDSFGRVGIVDVFFAALFLGCATRWGWSIPRGVVVLAIGMLVTSVLVLEGADIALPALPMLCIAALVAWGRPIFGDARRAWSGRHGSSTDSSDTFPR